MKYQTLRLISCTITKWTVKYRILRIYLKSFYRTIRKTKLIIITIHRLLSCNHTKKQRIMLMQLHIKPYMEVSKIKILQILVMEIKLLDGTFNRVIIQQMKTAIQLKLINRGRVKTLKKSRLYLPLMIFLLSLTKLRLKYQVLRKPKMIPIIMTIIKNTSQKE